MVFFITIGSSRCGHGHGLWSCELVLASASCLDFSVDEMGRSFSLHSVLGLNCEGRQLRSSLSVSCVLWLLPPKLDSMTGSNLSLGIQFPLTPNRWVIVAEYMGSSVGNFQDFSTVLVLRSRSTIRCKMVCRMFTNYELRGERRLMH